MIEDDVNFLEKFYRRHCNDEWEHLYGITIQTSDNPGWLITVSDPEFYEFLRSKGEKLTKEIQNQFKIQISLIDDPSYVLCGIRIFGSTLDHTLHASVLMIAALEIKLKDESQE